MPNTPPHRNERMPRAGDVLRLTRAASVQFTSPILLRLIRVHDWSTYTGWTWLDGYELNSRGDAIERRSLFVQIAGLQWVVLGSERPNGRLSGPQRAAHRPPTR